VEFSIWFEVITYVEEMYVLILQILYPDDELSYAHVCSKMF